MKVPFFSRWAPSARYRLPMPVVRLLERRLTCRRNRGAAERARRLAAFLAQMHGATGRIFPLDRRRLAAAHAELGTVDQIRTAIEILEAIGFIVRAPGQGNYRRLAGGGVVRVAVLWSFATIFERVFAFCRKSPKDILGLSSLSMEGRPKREENRKPIFGGVRISPPPAVPQPPRPIEINPALEAVLAKLGRGVAGALA